MNDLLQKLEAAIALDEQWALAASFPEDGGEAIPGGAHWVFGVGDNWDHYEPDPLEEFLAENLDDNGSIALRTMQEQDTGYGGTMPAVVVIIGIEQIRTVDAAHIVRNDPARVLRRVARDRKLLELHSRLYRDIGWLNEERDEEMKELPVCEHCVPKHSWFNSWEEVRIYPCETVRLLAEDYEIQVED